MNSTIVFLDPSPAVAAIIERNLRKRMASALIETGHAFPNRASALAELRRLGFSEEVVGKLGPGAVLLACRASNVMVQP